MMLPRIGENIFFGGGGGGGGVGEKILHARYGLVVITSRVRKGQGVLCPSVCLLVCQYKKNRQI